MLSHGRESNPRSSQVLYAGCSSLPVFPCVYAAGGVIHHLRAMPTALDCILLYQHVKDHGGCTVATRVHSSIPYGIGAPKLVGKWGIEPRSCTVLLVRCSNLRIFTPPVEKVADCRSWLPPDNKKNKLTQIIGNVASRRWVFRVLHYLLTIISRWAKKVALET